MLKVSVFLSHGPAAVRLSAFLLLAFAASAQDLRVPAITGNDDVFVMVNGDGTVSTWGIAGSTGFGDGARDPKAFRTTPEFVPAITNAVQAAAGSGHVLVRLADGSVVGWGRNDECEVGNGNPTMHLKRSDRLPAVYSPTRVTGLRNVRQIASGDRFSVALLDNGTLMAWGRPNQGRLGAGPYQGAVESLPCVAAPQPVPGISGARAISATYNHTLALLEDGTVMAFGSNSSGQLGDSTREPRAEPVKVQGVANAVAVSAGSGISVALLADGSVRTWGSNTNGLAGDPGDTDYKLTPGPVPGIANVKAIATGLGFVMVQLRDGTLRGWGESYYGGLGNKSGGDWFVKPQTPIGLGPVVAYYPVGRAVFAWKAGGTLMAWGVALMQADGKKTHSNVPVRLDVRAPR